MYMEPFRLSRYGAIFDANLRMEPFRLIRHGAIFDAQTYEWEAKHCSVLRTAKAGPGHHARDDFDDLSPAPPIQQEQQRRGGPC